MLAVCVPALVTRLRGSVSVLDLSKIEAGKLELNPEPVNLARHISEWRLWILRLTARARGRNNRPLPFYCACSGPGRRLKAAAQPLSRAHLAYLGCTFGSPPGVPGGGITLR